MRQLLALPTVFLFLAFGCSPASENPSRDVDLDAERAALMEADRAMFEAYSTSDSPLDALMAHFLDDANVLAPDAPLARGKEESRAVFAALYAMPGFSLAWSPSRGDASGDLGYTIGTYRIEIQDPEGNPLAIDGKYMTVWKKQPDGTWKVGVDMFNANGPAAAVEE
jgi:ketosteroid isomerase-like protein